MKMLLFAILLSKLVLLKGQTVEDMKVESRKINKAEFDSLRNAKLLKLNDELSIDGCNFYDLDTNSIVVENYIENSYMIYLDRKKYVGVFNAIDKNNSVGSFINCIQKDGDLEIAIEKEINDLGNYLNMDLSDINDTVLKDLDMRIKSLGPEVMYQQYFTNLVFVIGEYLVQNYNATWSIEYEETWPDKVKPVVINNKNSKFDVSQKLKKSFLETKQISLKSIVQFYALPDLDIYIGD